MITINGKKNLFLSEANQYVARLLQGDKMKQVELITSPQGQYSDKTAVINIVTKGSLPDGIVGNIMIDFGKDFIKPNLGVTSKIGKLVYNVNYQPGYTYYSELTDKTKVINYRDDTIHRTESELITWSKDDSHELQLNASYDFSDNDLLTFTGQYTYYREREFQEGKTTIWNKKDNKVQIYSILKIEISTERSGGMEKLIIRSRSGIKKGGFLLPRMAWKIIKGKNSMDRS